MLIHDDIHYQAVVPAGEASLASGKERVFTHFSLDDDRAKTLITTGAENLNLLMARRRHLHTELQVGVDDQYPVTVMIQTPAPPQGVLYLMLES